MHVYEHKIITNYYYYSPSSSSNLSLVINHHRHHHHLKSHKNPQYEHYSARKHDPLQHPNKRFWLSPNLKIKKYGTTTYKNGLTKTSRLSIWDNFDYFHNAKIDWFNTSNIFILLTTKPHLQIASALLTFYIIFL